MDFLAGVRVLEIARGYTGAYAGRCLADLGAEVIKVEPPDGDPLRQEGPFAGGQADANLSGIFHYFNAGKSGVTLDLRHPGAAAAREALLGEADLLLTDAPLPTLAAIGLDPGRLAGAFPALVHMSITPWGLRGPFCGVRAEPLNEWHASGAAFAVGLPDRAPLALPGVQAAYFGGANAAGAAVSALLARDGSGRAEPVDFSTIEALVTLLMGHSTVKAFHLGEPTQRTGHRLAGLAPHTHFPCKDGYVCVIGSQPVHWDRVKAALGEPEWTGAEIFADPRARYRHVEAFEDLMVAELSRHTKAEWFAIFWQHRAPGMPLYTVSEVLELEHLAARGFFAQVALAPGLAVTVPGVPLLIDGETRPPARRGPYLGEHNHAVYATRLGFPAATVAAWQQEGLI